MARLLSFVFACDGNAIVLSNLWEWFVHSDVTGTAAFGCLGLALKT